jgi:fatty-acyl-CoA synthase
MPAPFVEIRVMRPEGEAPPDGVTSGEIEMRGPWVAASYYNDPAQQDRWTNDGWFRTGDVATMDGEGYVRIVDRAKDLVKSGGEWISSIDVENTAGSYPGVSEAAVIAMPHERWGERPLLLVVPVKGTKIEANELLDFLSERLAKWWLPDRIVFVSELPKTGTGKVMKADLRKQYSNSAVAS